MKKLYVLFSLLAAFLPDAVAQQEPLYTQFFFNKMGLNPGYAGSFESPELSVTYRNQWMGLEGAPTTQALSYSQNLLRNRVGLGGNLVRNTIGINRTITLDVAYSYRIPLRRGIVGIGFQASMRHLYQNWNDERLVLIQSIDNAVPAEPKSKLIPNFGAGVYYTGSNWYTGIACPRVIKNSIDFAEYGSELSREALHFNLMAGITFDPNEDLRITPQVLLKYAFIAPLDAELNLSLLLKEKFYGGLTYRSGGESKGIGESIAALVGMQATENLFFCLSYDIGLTRLRRYNNGSIEAIARWYFNPPEGRTDKIDSPGKLPK